ncbi:c-type cytochrome [Bernardetia sp.]|uniref:c-type cytochrome n=1 Tax=Bernardetia sp. TaxID=1937974 RepID=UPI0025B9D188|nr:cytochrome c [Bernardetia sp.]
MKILFPVLSLLLSLLFCSCDSQKDKLASMSAEELAFQFPHLFDAPPPQEFIINTEKDTVIFGKSGTLLAIEAGTFTDENEKILKGNLTLKLKEALSLSEMLEHKLTTQTTDGQVLQSGGMIELTAKTDKKGKINISKPIHAEIPTLKKDGNMAIYKGVQSSENTPVRWKKEKELENWLTEIPLEKLNFFPKNEISNNEQATIYIPVDKATKSKIEELSREYRVVLVNKKPDISENIFHLVQNDFIMQDSIALSDSIAALPKNGEGRICGISKYILEGLSDKKFQGTFVSTYEFEKRVKAMNECCGNDLMAIYLKNLDKNLWEADKAAAEYLTKNKKCRAYVFEEFAKEKATKVKPQDKVNRALQKYIDKLFRNKEKAWEKFRKNYDKWEEKRQELQTDITEKMENERRFAERLNYSFDLNKFGWVNIDMLLKLPNQIPVTFDVKIKDLALKDAGRVFLIFPTDKVIIDLSRNEKGDFYGKQGESQEIIYLPEGREIVLKAVTQRNKQLYTGELNLVVKKKIKETIKVSETTDKEVASRIKKYEQKVTQSRFAAKGELVKDTIKSSLNITLNTRSSIVIRKDLSAKQFENALEKHYEKRPVLDDYAECCYEMDLVKGKQIFENECKQCHAIHKKIVGPALNGAESRWMYRIAIINFIKYPQKVIDGGNEYEQYLYEEYGQYMPNYDHLSDGDISSVLYYIEKESRNYSYSDFLEK